MSRLGEFFRTVTASVYTPMPPQGYDLGPSQPLPGPHVHPTYDQADTKPIAPYGATGTINYNGYLQPSDYNQDLQRFAALDVYERMRRSDPSVRETLWHVKAPIINAEWTIEPPSDPTDEEREHAAFVYAALFDWLEQPFTEMLEHILTYLDFGHAVHETVFQVVERSLTVRIPVTGSQGVGEQSEGDLEDQEPGGGADAEGAPGEIAASELPTATKNVVQVPVPLPPDTTTRVLPPRQFVAWRKFSPRLPRTIWRWNHDEFGELRTITQTVWVDLKDGTQGYRVLDIPAENLVVFTHEKWGDEYTGIALLRSAYKAWVMKEMIEKISGIAYERHGVGYLIGYLPREKAEDVGAQDKMLAMLENMRQDAVAVMPGPKLMSGASGQQGWLVEVLSPSGGIPNFEPILTYWRSEIAGAMLVRFKELGHAATGSRSTADVQAAVWYNALHAVARYIEARMNQAIRRLVDLNYPGVTRYPRLKASGIEARNLLEFAQAIALLTDAQALSADTNTRNWVRATMDAPPEDLAETRARMLFEAQQQAAQVEAAQQKAAAGVQSPTQKLKATMSPRGTETDGGENPGRPRTENAK